jgi:hypothetical protein
MFKLVNQQTSKMKRRRMGTRVIQEENPQNLQEITLTFQ